VEYWTPTEPFGLPKHAPGLWEFKSKTDLYEFKKVYLSTSTRQQCSRSNIQTQTIPSHISLSPDSSFFATFSLPDRQIRVFNFLTGKMIRKYDESLTAIQEMQQAGTAMYKVDDMEFGRRLAVERELEKDEKSVRSMNIIWDESGNFIIYPTLLGIKG
jgi:peptidylprolyl isomerase domain and WD repeat-containing protein 1